MLYHWLLERPDVLTGDSFFHLSALGEPLDGLNLCGAGRVVCLIDPVGDVYACPFVIDKEFLAGNVRDDGRLRRGVAPVGSLPLAARAAERRSLRLVRFLRRLPGRLHGGQVLHRPARSTAPTPSACSATARTPWRPATPGRTPVPPSATPRSTGTGRRIPVPTPVRFRTPRAPSAGRDVVDGGARRRHLARGRGDRTGRACWPSRSARSSSTAPICPSTPTPGSRWSWPTGSGPRPLRRRGGTGRALRRQRRARGVPGDLAGRP